LTAHSLQEDQYGVVQRDIPRILEALVKFSEALDAFVEEVVKGEMDAETEERVREVVYPNQTGSSSFLIPFYQS
jgi:nucleoporin NDC1